MTFFFTTLVIASSFAGLAGTKVNKTKQVVEEKSSKEPQILNEKDDAKTREAEKDNSERRSSLLVCSKVVGTQILLENI